MKIVVTGGRNYDHRDNIYLTLDKIKPTSVYVGDCKTGVDKLIEDYCLENNISYKVYEANWTLYKKAAGPIRNKKMVKEAKDNGFSHCVVFPGGRGTENCKTEAKTVGLDIIEINE